MKKRKWIILLFIFIIMIYIFHPIIMEMLFPIKFQKHIMEYSKEYQVDPYLIASIIKVESNYNPYAQSSKDARGLMQVLPSTGKWAAEELGFKNFYPEKLYDPETNIQIGIWYIKKLNQQFDRNLHLVLAAYNAGSGNICKWLEDKRYSNDGENLEYIPFEETRNYIKKVLFYYNLYQRIYNLDEFKEENYE
ncbi:lytic transglycosylase domain-containing protein [Garciella nitratireducens]|uniref:lytic transglycosylase domain-containing protein n=1 Tax=Garciella nitratireducens TaxID=218205 RepID=UPI0024B497F9|nr:lytic transglycosylase domain-containing protein [Garciella nitratireducens]